MRIFTYAKLGGRTPFPFFRKRAIIRVLEIAGDADDADAALGQFLNTGPFPRSPKFPERSGYPNIAF